MIRQLPAPGILAAGFILIGLVVWAPLPFGSVLPRERMILEIAAFTALIFALATRRGVTTLAPAAVPAGGLAAVGLFGLVQSLAWPAGFVEILAPEMAGVWHRTGELLGLSDVFHLSLAPEVSRSTALLWLAVAAVMAVSGTISGDRRSRRVLGLAFLVTAIFEIVYGANHYFEGRPTIWGRVLPAGGERLRGTFVNPDHFATYLVIALTAAFAWCVWSTRRALAGGALERRLLHAIMPWLAFVLLTVGLAFTGSRAGLLAVFGALAVQALLWAAASRRWQAGLVGFLGLAVAVLGLAVFGWRQGMSRWLATSVYEITWNMRLEVWQGSLELWRLFPWTGTGLGTFRQAFPRVQPTELGLSWFHAHSDPLELLVTTGVVGPLVLGVALVVLLRRLWNGLRRGRRSEDRATALAALGALVGTLAHASVDFGLSLPANAFVLAIVVGLGCGVSTTDTPSRRRPRHRRDPEPPAEEHPEPATRRLRALREG